jgi:multidrug resistance efflux pump
MDELVMQSAAARAEYLAQVDNRMSAWAANKRSFAAEVARARLQVSQLAATIAIDKRALHEMELDINTFIAQGQLDVNDLAIFRLQKMRASYATLEEKIEQNQQLKGQAEVALQDALERQEQFVKENQPEVGLEDDAAEELMAKQAEVIQRQTDEVLVELETLGQRESLELKAPFDGVVSLVQRQPGEVVLAGEPILTIAAKKPDNIVAYATEEQAARVKEEMIVQLVDRNRSPNLLVNSQVVYVGPTVEQIPARLWRRPNVPQWGRPILIEIPHGFDLIPGAVVGIRGI